MNKYKLLVLDVDGTLVKDTSQVISPRVIEAIKSLTGKITTILCTGRSLEDLDQIIPLLNLENSYNVIESGSSVLSPGLNIEFVRSVDLIDAKRMFNLQGSLISNFSICVDGNWRYSLDNIGDNNHITTVTFYFDDPSKSDEVISYFNEFKDKYHMAIGTQWGNPEGRQLMITHKDASKEKSLEYVQNKLGVTIEETVCIGDMPNDLPMFRRSGLKICMGNGDQKLKDASDLIVKSIDEDGVADAIENYILK